MHKKQTQNHVERNLFLVGKLSEYSHNVSFGLSFKCRHWILSLSLSPPPFHLVAALVDEWRPLRLTLVITAEV